jgi:hypothetical protein
MKNNEFWEQKYKGLARQFENERSRFQNFENYAILAVNELQSYRNSRLLKFFKRVNPGYSWWKSLGRAYQQLEDDTLIFNGNTDGYLLQPSEDLSKRKYIEYSFTISRPGLCGILLAVKLDIPTSKGQLRIEIIDSTKHIVNSNIQPAKDISRGSPVFFQFPPLNQGIILIRVFAERFEIPVSIYEWRRFKWLLGPLESKPFLGLQFQK